MLALLGRLLSFVEFAIDTVCMTLPSENLGLPWVSREIAMQVAFAGLSLFVLSIVVSATRDLFGGRSFTALLAALCVTGIGLLGLDRSALDAVFVTAYVPLVITLRFGEGLALTQANTRLLPWWTLPLFGSLLLASYIVHPFLPVHSVTLALTLWAILGVVTASAGWTRALRDSPLLNSPLTSPSLFLLFAATLAYVGTSTLETTLFTIALPVGLGFGLVIRKTVNEPR